MIENICWRKVIIIGLILSNVFPVPSLTSADSMNLQIIAALPNPSGTDKDLEWIRLYNNSEEHIDLSSYELSINGGKLNQISNTSLILAGKTDIYITRNSVEFLAKHGEVESQIQMEFSLVNSSSEIKITSVGQTDSYENTLDYSDIDSNQVTYLNMQCQKVNVVDSNDYTYMSTGIHFPEEDCTTDEIIDVSEVEDSQRPPPTVIATNTPTQSSIYNEISKNIHIGTDMYSYESSSKVREIARESAQSLPTIEKKPTRPPGSLIMLVSLISALLGAYLEFFDYWPVHATFPKKLLIALNKKKLKFW